ncbi:RBBP9/YdeN family alpha/beta hydrolase [Nocardia camponoti]|uniref:Alpha/beta hydrolase n=1 Tax=Nocardia camponoti TaxID=1616106 RepID=A0A917V4G8_9NOCA|nr:alpha/beta fold hydrolase [Nocardia camponoti]GGK35973.1 hypothetical protein GCM10011591_04500 [Nocardia camponoti]
MTNAVTNVYLAGIGNSEPEHWQRLWFADDPRGVWVEHSSWDAPVRDAWVKELDETLASITGPKFLIGHSLGSALAIEWAVTATATDVVGALLVALPDPRGENFPSAATGFVEGYGSLSHPTYELPFPTVAIASTNDPYDPEGRAAAAAVGLGASVEHVGTQGHLNLASNLGTWPQGRSILTRYFP